MLSASVGRVVASDFASRIPARRKSSLYRAIAMGLDDRKQRFTGSNLLLHRVAAVIDQDVDGRQGLGQGCEELAIALVTDEDLRTGLFEAFAVRVDVDPEELGIRAEVVAPHLQRPALRHPELDHIDRPPAKGREVPFVDVEVVHQLVDQAPFVVGKEMFRGRLDCGTADGRLVL